MQQISLKIVNQKAQILASASNLDYVNLVYKENYQPGDSIVLNVTEISMFLVIKLDDAMGPSFVYLRGGEYRFTIPFGEKHISYNPKAFSGNLHLLQARVATESEIRLYKNLALNEFDDHQNAVCFPHARATAETLGKSEFAARNAIDGNTENHLHGSWPYESWGINRDPNAEITIDFGRTVQIDKIVLFTRADFPHDNWWKQAQFLFSDGDSHTISMQKSDQPHVFTMAPKKVNWVSVGKLLMDEQDSSPFPALSQIAIYGNDIV